MLINGKPGKNVLVSVRVAGWDESMSVVLEKAWSLRDHLGSAPPGIEHLSHSQHGRQAATDHVPEWSIATEHWILIWQPNPTISKFLGIEDIQGFEHSGQHRNPGQPVLVKCLTACPLQFVERTIRHTAKELPGIFVPQFPKFNHLQEPLHRRRA